MGAFYFFKARTGKEMRRYNLGIDLDGVICNIYWQCFQVLKTMYPEQVKSNNWASKWEDAFNLSEKQIIDCFLACAKKGIFREAPLYPDAKYTLRKLSRYYNIFIVTWRNYIPNAKEDTLYWLDSNHIPYYRLVLTRNKFRLANNERFIFFLDDTPAQCNRVAKTQVPSYLFSRPWNKNEETDALVKTIYSWREVAKILLYC